MIREAIFPLERPNGIGLSPDEQDALRGRDAHRPLLGLPALRAGRDRVGERSVPRREGQGGGRAGRLPDVRFARRRRRGPRVRGHPHHRRGERYLARREPRRPVHAARHDGDQRLLRRPRSAHRLRHAVDGRHPRLCSSGLAPVFRSATSTDDSLAPEDRAQCEQAECRCCGHAFTPSWRWTVQRPSWRSMRAAMPLRRRALASLASGTRRARSAASASAG